MLTRAGGSAVHFHVMLSNQSNPLFHRAIIQSGAIQCPFGAHYKSSHRDEMYAFCKCVANIKYR